MAIKKNEWGTYTVDHWYRDDNRKLKRARKTFDTLTKARAWQDSVRTDVREGEYQPPSKKTIKEGVELYLQREKPRLKVQSFIQREGHCRRIVASFGGIPMTALTWQVIEARAREWDVSAPTANKHLQTLSRVYEVIGKRLGILRNPCEHVDPIEDRDEDIQEPGVLRAIEASEVYSAQEIAALIAASEPGLHRIRHMLAVHTGARHGELNALSWDDVDLAGRKITINKSMTELKGEFKIEPPKTKSAYREIAIGPKLTQELKRWKLACIPTADNLVLPDPRGRAAMRGTSNRALKATARRAGIRELSMNHLRHSFASQSLIAGVHPLEVSMLMGHSSPAITLKVYSRWCPREPSKAAELLESRFKAH